MKTIVIGVLITGALLTGLPVSFYGDQEVEMQVLADEAFQSKVKVYDFDGNLIKEMRADDVALHEISVTDFFILESSGFAFKYLGDYYYLTD